jgi:hypothetical protein
VGGLFGRLVASYVVVTLLAALVIEAAVSLGESMSAAYNPDNTEPLVTVMESRYAPNIANDLTKEPQSYQGDLYRRLNEMLNVLVLRANGQHIAIAMLDPQSRIVAISSGKVTVTLPRLRLSRSLRWL